MPSFKLRAHLEHCNKCEDIFDCLWCTLVVGDNGIGIAYIWEPLLTFVHSIVVHPISSRTAKGRNPEALLKPTSELFSSIRTLLRLKSDLPKSMPVIVAVVKTFCIARAITASTASTASKVSLAHL